MRNAADVLIYNIMLSFIRVCAYIYSGDPTARIHPRLPVREGKRLGEGKCAGTVVCGGLDWEE